MQENRRFDKVKPGTSLCQIVLGQTNQLASYSVHLLTEEIVAIYCLVLTKYMKAVIAHESLLLSAGALLEYCSHRTWSGSSLCCEQQDTSPRHWDEACKNGHVL